jgi:hypothetical protein
MAPITPRAIASPVRHDARYPGLGRQLVGDRLAGGGHLGRVDVAVLGRDEEEDVGGAGAELLVEELVGLGGLGRRVLEAAGDEPFGDAAPEDDGGRGGHRPDPSSGLQTAAVRRSRHQLTRYVNALSHDTPAAGCRR